MAAYQFYTKKCIDRGVDFANIFPEKQQKVSTMRNAAYSLPDIVEFLRVQTNNFTKQDERFIDLDNAIRRIVSMSSQAIPDAASAVSKTAMQPKKPISVAVGMTPIQKAEPAMSASVVVEPEKETVVVEGTPQFTKDDLEATLDTLKDLLEDDPKNEELLATVDVISEMIEDLKAKNKFATGGEVEDGHDTYATGGNIKGVYVDALGNIRKKIDKEVRNLYKQASDLLSNHINNDGTLDFSEKEYGYLSDELDDVAVGFLKDKEADGDYANGLRKEKFTMTAKQAYDTLKHRIESIQEELGTDAGKVNDQSLPSYAKGGGVKKAGKKTSGKYNGHIVMKPNTQSAVKRLIKSVVGNHSFTAAKRQVNIEGLDEAMKNKLAEKLKKSSMIEEYHFVK